MMFGGIFGSTPRRNQTTVAKKDTELYRQLAAFIACADADPRIAAMRAGYGNIPNIPMHAFGRGDFIAFTEPPLTEEQIAEKELREFLGEELWNMKYLGL